MDFSTDKFAHIELRVKKKETPRLKVDPVPSDPKFNSSIIKRLLNMRTAVKNTNTTVEVEASFGRFYTSSKTGKQNFDPGKTEKEWKRVFQYFNDRVIDRGGKFNFTEENYRIIMMGPYREKVISGDFGSGSILQKKTRARDSGGKEQIFNIYGWGIRVGASYESYEAEDDPPEWVGKYNSFDPEKNDASTLPRGLTIRDIERYSYRGVPGTIWSYFSVDVSRVTQTSYGKTSIRYEIELERKIDAPPQNLPELVPNFLACMTSILMVMSGEVEELEYSVDGKGNKIVLGQDTILSEKEKHRVYSEWNSFFPRFTDSRNKMTDRRNKPEPLKIKDVISDHDQYAMTVKYDGVRKFLLICYLGVYLLNPPYEVQKISDTAPKKYHRTLLDGELVGTDYYVFDVLSFAKENVQEKDLDYRLSKVSKDVLLDIQRSQKSNLGFFLKKFYGTDKQAKPSFRQLFEQVYDEYDNEVLPVDGVIFQPIDAPYYTKGRTKKWKPENLLTIDFALLSRNNSDSVFDLYVQGPQNLVPFTGSKTNPQEFYVTYKDGVYEDEEGNIFDIQGQVAEMVWNRGTNKFEILRMRPDRDKPNYVSVAIDDWKEIQKPLSATTLKGQDMILGRRYCNQIKMDVLNVGVRKGGVIVDIGSGRGGDLDKWKHLNLSKIIVIEPNQDNLKELRSRAKKKFTGFKITRGGKEVNETMLDRLIIINEPIQNTSQILDQLNKNKIQRVSSVTAFFSLTFLFKNQGTLNGLVETVSKILYPGGNFFGIVLDGDVVEKQFGVSEKNVKGGIKLGTEDEIGGESWSIEKKGNWTEEPFDNKAVVDIKDESSMVKNVEEPLFYYQVFKEALKRRGMNPIDGFTYMIGNSRKTENSYDVTSNYLGYLSENQIKYLRLNRVFGFYKLHPPPVPMFIPIATVDQAKSMDVSDSPTLSKFNGRLVRIGTIGDGSCLPHAIVRAFSKKYATLTIPERKVFITNLRQTLAKRLSYDKYEKIARGILADYMQNQMQETYPHLSEKRARLQGYEQFRYDLSLPGFWLGVEILEYLSESLDINIYVLSGQTLRANITGDCNNLYKDRLSVAIFHVAGNHYETLGLRASEDDNSEISTMFNQDNDFIQVLYKDNC